MSKLAKFKAKGSDLTKKEWERILEGRRLRAYYGRIFIEKGERKYKGVIEIENKR